MRRISCVLGLLFLSLCAMGDTSSQRLDQQGYIQELERWTTIVQDARDGKPSAIPVDVPKEWIVSQDGTEYHVPTIFLARDLSRAEEADLVLARLTELRQSASQGASATEISHTRDVATRVLERREYRRVRLPGAEASLSDRISAAVRRFLGKLFGKAFEHVADLRVLSDFVVWTLLLCAAAALLFWLRRAFLNATTAEMRISAMPPESVAARPPEEWLGDARAAAAKGEYRLAVRLVYWGAISGLERAEAWKPDRARTPREYLRLTRGSQYENTLRPLTRDFERVWYAKQPATEADFRACMTRVQELGCQ